MIDISHLSETEANEFMKAHFASREAGRAVSRFGAESPEEADACENAYEEMLDDDE